MGRNNRENRKRKKREQKSKAKNGRTTSIVNELNDARSTELVLRGLADTSQPFDILYSLFRRTGLEQKSSVWIANSNVIESYAYARKPVPLAECNLKEACKAFDAHLDINYSAVIRKLQLYSQVADWMDRNNPLLLKYLHDHDEEPDVLDLPAIMHFHLAGWLDYEHDHVYYCLSYLTDWCEMTTHMELLDMEEIFRPGKSLPKANLLKKLEACLKRLNEQSLALSESPLYSSFIQPSLISLIQKRFEKVSESKLKSYPYILLQKKASTDQLSNRQVRSNFRPVSISNLDANLLSQLAKRPGTEKTFLQHIGSFVLQWRYWTEHKLRKAERSGSSLQQEQQAFVALWTALSRGVPESHKAFTSKVKDLCLNYTLDCLGKWPEYQPLLSNIEALTKHNPSHEVLAWLQIALCSPKELQRLLSRIPEKPKAMSFDQFYALYQTHKLKDRPEFIKRFFDALPSEAQREILVPWFRRASDILGQPGEMNNIKLASFGKLLRMDRFPVSELYGDGELEDNLVMWSLAFLFDCKIRVGALSESRLSSVLSAVVRIRSSEFWQAYGEPILIELLPQLLEIHKLQSGLLDKLVPVLESHKGSKFQVHLQSRVESLDPSQSLDSNWTRLLEFLSRSSSGRRTKKSPTHGRSAKKTGSTQDKPTHHLPF
jgi:hypothetical protein